MSAIIKQGKAAAIISMRVGIQLTLTRKLSDAEYDLLEGAGISVYGSGDGKDARYELGCHNSAELGVAHAFLASMQR